MLKKLLVGTLLVGLIGILVYGAVIRTADRTSKVAESAQGQGGGRGRSTEEISNSSSNNYGRGRSTAQDTQNWGGQGAGQGAQSERQYLNAESVPETWETVEGAVVQVPETGAELIIETAQGEELEIGMGPMDLAAEGFVLEVGEIVRVHGYWESNEFKAAQLTRLADGQTIALRDESGRPAWAGNGRNAQESRESDQSGLSQAQVDGWLQLSGQVTAVDTDALSLLTTSGDEIIVEGRPWSFAQEQGFSTQTGEELTLTGFFEGEDFEVGQIENVSTGQTVVLRDESGRPMWAGRGSRGA
jgi:hypothetical protein